MKKTAVAIALLLASLALVACGGSDDDGSETAPQGGAAQETEANEGESGGSGGESEAGKEAGGGETVSFEADPAGGLAYTVTSATANAGKATLELNNPQPAGHDVALESSGGETVGKTDVVAESSSSTTVDLKSGEYTFYCSVPGHREAGMEGTLTVK